MKVYPPPDGIGADGHFHVYVFDVFNKEFLPGRVVDSLEKAASFQRHEQERIYTEQEAEPELFDLPFVSSDADLLAHIGRDPAYKERLMRELTSDARQRARRR
jgi:hypothetical protein